MANENTGGPSDSPSAAGSKASGDAVTPDTFQDMVEILRQMRRHTHQYFDDYTTVCECQCQCNRGTL